MDNTVGSLTQEQKSIIIGSILGDGYLRIVPGRKNAFLEINHSVSERDYVDWKYQKLKNLVKSPPKIRKGKGKRIVYKEYYRLRIKQNSAERFKNLIENYVIPKMKYKLE